ncbi:uncharacterized protein LOC133783805 [Humulus lupulus]|uniref:uncharacterized protein LOC133783805 n=1 Tax=Humulus lupulus TaxID=3486 RepID=UPI002B408487|nr:uncharacterized protein LOC133783805 [Humulus lupulus]
MGTLVGHIAPGLAFLVIGLWHLFNHTKLHILHPNSYTSQLWFPTTKFRYAELFLIMASSAASITMELFVAPKKHQPLDPDGTIPTNHLHNFEHASISLAIFVYAALVIVLDQARPKAPRILAYLLASVAFAQELLLFVLHSTDHRGTEGHYHLFLQLIIFVSLVTTLMGIGFPNSFAVSFVRSLSIFFQGVWFNILGVMLYTPRLLSKGCFLYEVDGHTLIKCPQEKALHRAKSLITLEFSWCFVGVAIFGVSFYLVMAKIYGDDKVDYFPLGTKEVEHEAGDEYYDDYDVESPK